MQILRTEQNADAAHLMDVFDRWLNVAQTAVAMWRNDAEDYWPQAVKDAKEAYDIVSSKKPVERVYAGVSAYRLLGCECLGESRSLRIS